MIKLHFSLLLACLLGLVTVCHAETSANNFIAAHKDFFQLLNPQSSDIELGILYEPEHEEDGGPGEFDLLNLYGKVALAYPTNDETYLSFGGTYEHRNYDFKNVVSLTQTNSETLHKIEFNLGGGTFLSDDLLARAEAQFGSYSDLEENFDTDALKLYGTGDITYRINPFTQLLVGVRARNDFSDQDIIPVLGLRLLSGEGKFHFSITAPVEATVTYNASNITSFYATGSISGDEYRVTAGPTNREFDVEIHDQRLGLGATHWLGEHVRLNVEVGMTIGSELEFKTRGAGQFGGDLDDSPYATARLGFSL